MSKLEDRAIKIIQSKKQEEKEWKKKKDKAWVACQIPLSTTMNALWEFQKEKREKMRQKEYLNK